MPNLNEEAAKALIDELVTTAEFSLNQGEHGDVRAAYILNWASKFRAALADHQGEQG